MKMLMLMISFECTTEIVGKTPGRSQQPQNLGDADQPAQPQVSS